MAGAADMNQTPGRFVYETPHSQPDILLILYKCLYTFYADNVRH